MFNNHSTSYRWGVIIAALLVVPAFAATPALADSTQFSGQATGVRATVAGLGPVTLSDTGPLPAEGGQKETSLLSANVPGLLTANVFHSSTIGQGDRSRSKASVADLNLTVAGNTIGASFLMARATAVCGPNNSSSVSGDSEIAELVINGQTISVGTDPNQTIPLPLDTGKVIINEQSGNSSDITVNALHVIVYGVADVIVASAHADVRCLGKPVCDPSKDFVTGGGWIVPPSGSKANFAVAGGLKNGQFWGHLQYIDHGKGMKVKGTALTAYQIVDETLRHIEGNCEIDGVSGYTYVIDVADQGEPGRGADVFSIKLSNGYGASDKLAGGNIQIHTPCR
jgi:hypothetical protein